jgi:hypothetical protein
MVLLQGAIPNFFCLKKFPHYMRAKPGFYTPPFSNIFQIYFWSSLYAEKIALWQGPFSKKVEKFLARQKCPHYMRRKWHFGRGLWRIFPIKKYPSTIRGKNGVLIPPFALKNCRKFCSLLYAGKTGFLHPPQANFSLIFCPLLYAGKTGSLHPPPAHIFQKIFVPHYTRRKSQFINPLAEDFMQKICPSLYASKNAFWQPPILKKRPHI